MTQGRRKKLGLEGKDRENGGDAGRAVALISQVQARMHDLRGHEIHLCVGFPAL